MRKFEFARLPAGRFRTFVFRASDLQIMLDQKVYKSGSSLVVVVPSDFVGTIGIKKGDKVRVKSDVEKGAITYIFSGAKQLTLPRVVKKQQ